MNTRSLYDLYLRRHHKARMVKIIEMDKHEAGEHMARWVAEFIGNGHSPDEIVGTDPVARLELIEALRLYDYTDAATIVQDWE